MQPKYKRVILKISGEALAGEKGVGLSEDMLEDISEQIKDCVQMGVQMAIVVGGGNFWRGRSGKKMDRTRADHMGMLATVINALAIQDALERVGVTTRVQTAIEMRSIAEPYIRGRAVRNLEKGRVVVFACGTGNPFFSTDTAAALRAAEVDADVILLAKNVDGVYDSDPRLNNGATRFESIDYLDVLNRGLGVMDSTAVSLCMDNKIPILVFALGQSGNIKKAIVGEKIGTLVHEKEMLIAKNFGYVMATKMLVDNTRRVRYMYREEPSGEQDSGWRFFCGDEPQEYVENSDNIAIYNVKTILAIDPSIEMYLNSKINTVLEREDENAEFSIRQDCDFKDSNE